MNQHEKIIDFSLDGNWHCQNEYRRNFIFSPHKRRAEIESKGKYYFIKAKCEHGVRGQFDYLMKETEVEFDKMAKVEQKINLPELPRIEAKETQNAML